MCNDFGNNIPYSDYLAAFSQIRAPVVFPAAAPNLEPRDDIRPTEPAPVLRRREDGVEMVQLRWGLPPARPKGAPVINFRSKGRRFPRGVADDPLLLGFLETLPHVTSHANHHYQKRFDKLAELAAAGDWAAVATSMT